MKAFSALVVLTSLVGGSNAFMVLPAADTSRGVALRADILSTEDIDFDGTLHDIGCHDFHRTPTETVSLTFLLLLLLLLLTNLLAPTQRAAAVGNVIKTPTIGFGDFQFGVPRFLAKAFGADKKKSQREEVFLLDEECYLGKDGSLDDCADYDPPHHSASP